MSAYALGDSLEALSLNGKVSNRQILFAVGFATSNVEQFSSIFDMRMLGKAVFEVLNLGDTNGLKYTIYGAIDPNIKWEPLPNAQDQVLAAVSSKAYALSDAFSLIRIGVVSNVAGNSTTVQVLVEGKSI